MAVACPGDPHKTAVHTFKVAKKPIVDSAVPSQSNPDGEGLISKRSAQPVCATADLGADANQNTLSGGSGQTRQWTAAQELGAPLLQRAARCMTSWWEHPQHLVAFEDPEAGVIHGGASVIVVAAVAMLVSPLLRAS